jgi:pterin-4a-carbinolamine dehydratase
MEGNNVGERSRREDLHALPRRHPTADAGRGRGLPLAGARWSLMDGAARIERRFRFSNFREAFAFVVRAAELAEAEGNHPDISFGWGYATVSLRTKKIKGLHENDFIMAAKLDRIAGELGKARQEG